MQADELIRSHIRSMKPYHPVKPFEILAEELGYDAQKIVKLDANENPYGTLEAAREALSNLAYSHIYPDSQSEILVREISKWQAVPHENLIVGSGADELIDLTMRLMLDPGDTLLTSSPTFGMYSFDAAVQNAELIDIPRNSDFTLNLDLLEQAVRKHRPKLIFMASPNNPDGSLASPELVEKMLSWPVITVLDEAYIEFAGEQASWIDQVARRENLIVLRTFSKWAGLAGLRVGYGAFPTSLVPHLKKIKQPYAVSVAAQAAAIAAVKSQGELERIGRLIVQERERLFQELSRIGYLDPYPSKANFILCRVVGRDAEQVTAALRQKGILIRYFNKPGLQDHIRISVGKAEQTDRVIKALKQLEVKDA
jgi:histidinol-phosphate aminotransferase